MNTITIVRSGSLLILVAFAVSCVPVATVSTATSLPPITEQTITMTVTSNTASLTTPTGTALPPTITATVLETGTPIPVDIQPMTKWAVSECSDNGDVIEPPPGYGIPGTILYLKNFEYEYDEYGLIGGTPLTRTTIPIATLADFNKEGLPSFGFSPNGQWLAYGIYPGANAGEPARNSQNWRLGLFSYLGIHTEINLKMEDVLKVIAEYAYLAFMDGVWINNDLLYVRIGYASGGNMSYSEGFILDPFEGVWREDLFAEVPELDRMMPFAVSPDLTRILYYRYLKGPVLWDIAQRRVLWAGELALFNGILIRWAPDSSLVAYDTGTEQAILDRDGNVEVSLAELTPQGSAGYTFQWSPDSQQLAFDVYVESIRVLYIYDTVVEQTVYLCPYGGSILYWSPDGNYIAFENNRPPSLYVAVVSLQDGVVTKLADDIDGVLGWSDKFTIGWFPEK